MNVRCSVLITLVLAAVFLKPGAGSPPDEGYEYHTSLSYYSRPITFREWSISIYRQKAGIYIDIDNYKNRTVKRPFPGDEYLKLVDFLNRKGIWRLKGNYSQKSKNCYYEIKVRSGGYANSFRVEAGPVLSGESSRYREMVRYFTNLAHTALEE